MVAAKGALNYACKCLLGFNRQFDLESFTLEVNSNEF